MQRKRVLLSAWDWILLVILAGTAVAPLALPVMNWEYGWRVYDRTDMFLRATLGPVLATLVIVGIGLCAWGCIIFRVLRWTARWLSGIPRWTQNWPDRDEK